MNPIDCGEKAFVLKVIFVNESLNKKAGITTHRKDGANKIRVFNAVLPEKEPSAKIKFPLRVKTVRINRAVFI